MMLLLVPTILSSVRPRARLAAHTNGPSDLAQGSNEGSEVRMSVSVNAFC